jgi:hypothetical protein
MFANRYAIWTGADTDLHPESDVPTSLLSSGSEEGEFQTFPSDEANIREVLDTGLFAARGSARMGWAHQSYAEFLAAYYLIAKGVPARNLLKLFLHPSGGLVPQLSTVAAWAAALSKEIRARLISHDPLALFKGDLSNWDIEDLVQLTDSLLTAYESQKIHDFLPGIAHLFSQLAYPGLESHLLPYIVDRTKDFQARRTACSIAEACKLTRLQSDLLRVALDPSDDPSVRARAVSALGVCSDDSVARQLLPLAMGSVGNDRMDDIKGNSLEALWPKHLKASELFSTLTPPNEGHFGSYAAFLTMTLPENLSPIDLAPALHWATEVVRAEPVPHHDFHRKALCDAILVLGWKSFEKADLTQLFIEHVFVRLKDGGELFRGVDNRMQKEFYEELDIDDTRRRAFLLFVSRSVVGRIEAFALIRARFLKEIDLDWLLSKSPIGVAPDSEIDAETLCDMIECTFDLNNASQFDAFYPIAARWEPLKRRYAGIFEGVRIDSAEAVKAKELLALRRRLERRRPPPINPPPAQRVKDCLARFENGELDAWGDLNLQLTLSTDSTHYGADQDFLITKMPGWHDADEEIRTRIAAAGERYLREAEPSVSEWLGTTSYYRSDYAAYRSLILLRQTRWKRYEKLGLEVWRKWAPLVAAVDRLVVGEEKELHDTIAAEACSAAPTEFVETVRKLIQSERASAPKDLDKAQQLASFPILRRLEKCWDNSAIKEVIFAEMQDGKNSPWQFQVLLEALLSVGFGPARELAISRLADTAPDRRAFVLAAAFGLASYSAINVWPKVWTVVLEREDIGKELFLQLAEFRRFQANFLVGLPEQALEELYLWLAEKFPYHEDPHHISGVAHWVGPREMVAQLRDGVLQHLVSLGTEHSLKSMRTIISKRPDLTWLPLELARAEQVMRTKTWSPLTPAEVLRLSTSQRGRLVQSPDDLCEALVDALREYESQLHGEQTEVQFLWNKQVGGLFIPVDENAFSDHVKVFLQRVLRDNGVVLNREVELGRIPGAPVGSRTDIKVDAIRRSERGDSYDAIVAIIETKGCWNSELFTAIETQLRDDYLTRLGAPLGIYLVGWFDKAKWDDSDSRKKRAPSVDLQDLRRKLDDRAAKLSKDHTIRAVVIDCHAH